MRLAPLLVSLLLLLPAHAVAQQVRGVVGDVASRERLSGTLVVAVDRARGVRATTLTDSLGSFHLSVPAGDTLHLEVQHFGYAPQRTGPLALGPADTVELTVGLRPQPLRLEEVAVRGGMNRNLERFLRNQRRGFGSFLSPEEILRIDATTTAELLVRMPGAFLLPAPRGGVMAVMRPEGLSGAGMCTPVTYVDGVRLDGPVNAHVSASKVRAVEVYRDPANAPPEYQRSFMGPCPVLLIWTDHGFEVREAR